MYPQLVICAVARRTGHDYRTVSKVARRERVKLRAEEILRVRAMLEDFSRAASAEIASPIAYVERAS